MKSPLILNMKQANYFIAGKAIIPLPTLNTSTIHFELTNATMAVSHQTFKVDEREGKLSNRMERLKKLDRYSFEVADEVVNPFSHSEVLGYVSPIIRTYLDFGDLNNDSLQYPRYMNNRKT